MKLQLLQSSFSASRFPLDAEIPANIPFSFLSRTDDELSLVCPAEHVPMHSEAREDGWKALRIVGVLDFGLVGILASIASILAENGIPIFAISTYNTDYVLVKETMIEKTIEVLRAAGYEII